MRRLARLAFALACCVTSPSAHVGARAASAGDPAPAPIEARLLERARQVAALVCAEPVWPVELFDDAFRKNVPADDLRRLLATTFASEGAVTSVARVDAGSPSKGRFELACEKGGVLWCDLRLGDGSGGPIRYLRTYGSVPGYPDRASAAKAFGELDGQVSFAVVRLGGERPESSRRRIPTPRSTWRRRSSSTSSARWWTRSGRGDARGRTR